MEFMDLPPEILQKIVCFLSDEDLCRLRETCSKLRATCDADVVWTTLCSSHYGVQFTPTRNSSARIFYQKTLRAFVRNGLLKVKPHSLWLRIRFYRNLPVKYFRFRSLINNKSLADTSLITHLSDLSHFRQTDGWTDRDCHFLGLEPKSIKISKCESCKYYLQVLLPVPPPLFGHLHRRCLGAFTTFCNVFFTSHPCNDSGFCSDCQLNWLNYLQEGWRRHEPMNLAGPITQ